jgi:hypothetical protein
MVEKLKENKYRKTGRIATMALALAATISFGYNEFFNEYPIKTKTTKEYQEKRKIINIVNHNIISKLEKIKYFQQETNFIKEKRNKLEKDLEKTEKNPEFEDYKIKYKKIQNKKRKLNYVTTALYILSFLGAFTFHKKD